MSYRVLFLANPVKLSVKNEQLMIDNGEIARIPLVDLFVKQFSVYCRVCNGYDDVEKHKARIRQYKPDNGSVRLLVITEKQYEKMELIIGNLVKEEEHAGFEQLSIF